MGTCKKCRGNTPWECAVGTKLICKNVLVNIKLGRAAKKILIFFPKRGWGSGRGWRDKKNLHFPVNTGLLWPHRGQVGSDTFMASWTHLWPSRTPKNLPRPEGPRFLQHISKNFCRAGQFYNATLFFCRYEAITVLAQSDFTLILLNKHGLVGFSRTVGQIVSEPGNESDSSALFRRNFYWCVCVKVYLSVNLFPLYQEIPDIGLTCSTDLLT